MIKHLYFIILCWCLFFSTSNAQTFSNVGCVNRYEGISSMESVQGKLYVGNIGIMCQDTFKCTATWDDSTWQDTKAEICTLNYGGLVKDFIWYKNELYMCGEFPFVGKEQIPSRGIARWNGVTWDSLTSKGINVGPSNSINCMAVFQGELYVAGKFTEIDGNPAKNIAKWDGQKWTVIPGVQSDFTSVNAMVVYKGELYVAGHFWYAGTQPAAYIARWTGSYWRVLQNGVNYFVNSMVVDTVNDMLYVAGNFGVIDNTYFGRVARWDGENWHPVGEGNFSSNGVVSSIEMYQGFLYAAMNTNSGKESDTTFARWNGKSWEKVGGFSYGQPILLKTYNDKLYIAGNFLTINGDSIPNLASYSDTTSTVISTGIGSNESRAPNFKLYPNPSKEALEIAADFAVKEIEIYNTEGKLMARPSPIRTIQIQQLPSGSYLLKIYDGNHWYAERFHKD